MDQKLYRIAVTYNILHKILIVTKPLCIMFHKIDGFIWDYDETKYLVLLAEEKMWYIYDSSRYPIVLEGSVAYVFSHKYAKISINSDDNLPLEKTLSLL